MTLAYFCDKCMKIFPEDKVKHTEIELGYQMVEKQGMDLCDKCHSKLEDFVYE